MVFKKSEIKNIVLEFAKEASKNKLKVDCIFIFGSYAYGTPRHNSDIDLAVISEDFEKMNDIRRIMLLSNLARRIKIHASIDINLVGYTWGELDKSDYFDLAGEIRDKGKIIFKAK